MNPTSPRRSLSPVIDSSKRKKKRAIVDPDEEDDGAPPLPSTNIPTGQTHQQPPPSPSNRPTTQMLTRSHSNSDSHRNTNQIAAGDNGGSGANTNAQVGGGDQLPIGAPADTPVRGGRGGGRGVRGSGRGARGGRGRGGGGRGGAAGGAGGAGDTGGPAEASGSASGATGRTGLTTQDPPGGLRGRKKGDRKGKGKEVADPDPGDTDDEPELEPKPAARKPVLINNTESVLQVLQEAEQGRGHVANIPDRILKSGIDMKSIGLWSDSLEVQKDRVELDVLGHRIDINNNNAISLMCRSILASSTVIDQDTYDTISAKIDQFDTNNSNDAKELEQFGAEFSRKRKAKAAGTQKSKDVNDASEVVDESAEGQTAREE